MEYIILSGFLLISFIFNIYLTNQFLYFIKSNEHREVLSNFVKSSKPLIDEEVSDEDSEYLSAFDVDYVEQMQRNQRFAERMAEIKEELIEKGSITPAKENIAEELHPLVHNIPHESIRVSYAKEITEVSK